MSSPTARPVALVVGASRGIGRQIAVDLAKDGYAVVVAAKSTTSPSDLAKLTPFPPDPNSSKSTITTVAKEITLAGGEATAIPVDTTNYDSIKQLIAKTIEVQLTLPSSHRHPPPPPPTAKAPPSTPDLRPHLHLIYNSGAIFWASVASTPMKRFQLMQRVNVEGLYGTIQEALPHLKRNEGSKGRIVVGIESAATEQFTRKDPDYAKDLRKATIFSDAILAMLKAPVSVINGQLELDEDFLRKHAGVTDFSKYSVVPGTSPRRIMPAELPDLTVKEQDDQGMRVDSSKL
ncbi:hypothetical protein N0V88_005911 [Collariella sp. IMI 366227]|nr:hypothetical protein N0V88_005911 [Collariella sp. IMI 366227]